MPLYSVSGMPAEEDVTKQIGNLRAYLSRAGISKYWVNEVTAINDHFREATVEICSIEDANIMEKFLNKVPFRQGGRPYFLKAQEYDPAVFKDYYKPNLNKTRDLKIGPNPGEDPGVLVQPLPRKIDPLPLFIFPCKILWKKIRRIVNKKAKLKREKQMVERMVRGQLRRRIALALEHREEYISAVDIVTLYRQHYPPADDELLVDKVLEDIRTSFFWPKNRTPTTMKEMKKQKKPSDKHKEVMIIPTDQTVPAQEIADAATNKNIGTEPTEAGDKLANAVDQAIPVPTVDTTLASADKTNADETMVAEPSITKPASEAVLDAGAMEAECVEAIGAPVDAIEAIAANVDETELTDVQVSAAITEPTIAFHEDVGFDDWDTNGVDWNDDGQNS